MEKASGKPAVEPSIVIPVTPLGFSPPAPFYLGQRFAHLSLQFLDEDNLLFTFRVPGLIAREAPEEGQTTPDDPASQQRHIRALVLSLPDGKVTAEALWTLHDYSPYLWMLRDRRFLLRDRNSVQIGDETLHLQPYLRFPGPISFLEFDPAERLMVANSSEPAPASGAENRSPNFSPNSSHDSSQDSSQDASGPQSGRIDAQPGTSGSFLAPASTAPASTAPASTAPASVVLSGQTAPAPSARHIVRILRMDTRSILFVSRSNGAVHLPIDGEGYYEALHGNKSNGYGWVIAYEPFAGGSVPLVQIESTCNPALDVQAPGVVLASACTGWGGRRLIAIPRNPDIRPKASATGHPDAKDKLHANDRRTLWDVSLPPNMIWPVMVQAADGPRMARATLDVAHSAGAGNSIDQDDIRGQTVQVYDLATGKLELSVPASPVLDAGGNFALSPSGQRFAVLHAGQIEVYNLPPAPALQSLSANP